MEFQELSLWWADKGAAERYRSELLSPEDARRAAALRSARARDDWRVSRALLQRVRADQMNGACALSLSHSGGHALCARAPAGWEVGVDLERLRPRDTAALAAWVCDGAERVWLARAGAQRRLERFYLLWTLKEAFVKAAGLDFPADMVSVGLTPGAAGRLLLRPPPGRWQASAWALGEDWVMAAVWRGPDAARGRIDWRAVAPGAWPTRRLLGQWTGRGG